MIKQAPLNAVQKQNRPFESLSDGLCFFHSPKSGLFIFIFAADYQQRQMALAHHGFGKAAHQQMHQAGAAVGAEHKQIGALFIGIIHQLLRHFARAFVGHQQMLLHIGHT